MHSSTKQFVLVSLGILVVVAVAVVSLGLYPVLRVDGAWYDQRDVARRVATTLTAVQHGADDDSDLNSAEVRTALEMGVIDTIIQERVLYRLAQEVVDDLDSVIAQKIEESRQPDLQESVQSAYGISFEEFEHLVLRPAALVDSARDALGQEELERQLQERIVQADVSIYLLPYSWEHGVLSPNEPLPSLQGQQTEQQEVQEQQQAQ